jgi:hypothetical protein
MKRLAGPGTGLDVADVNLIAAAGSDGTHLGRSPSLAW